MKKKMSNTRIVVWASLWLIGIILAMGVMGLHGWPWRFSSLEPYLYLPNGWGHGAFTIEYLRSTLPKKGRFVFIGGSAGLEAITSDADAEKRLQALIGAEGEFASVCSSYTTLTDVAKIVNRLGPYGGTIIILVEPPVFSKGADLQLKHHLKDGKTLEKYYFLETPDKVRKILTQYGVETGFAYSLINYLDVAPGMLIGSIPRNFPSKRKGPWKRHLLDQRAADANIKGFIESIKSTPSETIDLNKDLLGAAVEIAKSNGCKVALLNFPNAEPYRADIEAAIPYDKIISELIEKYDPMHIDMRYAAPWPRDDFWDSHHMTPQGQDKFTGLLVERLAALVKTGKTQ